jgi:hypothetical protein
MMKKATVIVVGTLLVVACGRSYTPSSPSQVPGDGSSSSTDEAVTPPTLIAASLGGRAERRVGFGFNGTVNGVPTGKVFITGGGAYELSSHFVNASGGFSCIDAVLQGPLSISINPNHPGACLKDEGIRWDTAALLGTTTFKCTGSATEETAETNDNTVVLQADFYRTGDGNEESFTARMIVSNGDISEKFPGANLWVQGVGCGTAQAVNFSN